jgi:hypothetical protein
MKPKKQPLNVELTRLPKCKKNTTWQGSFFEENIFDGMNHPLILHQTRMVLKRKRQILVLA